MSMKFLILFLMSYIIGVAYTFGQKVYSIGHEYQADVKVFVVDAEYEAGLVVFKTDKDFKAKKSENKRLWHICPREYQADKKDILCRARVTGRPKDILYRFYR